MSEPQRTCDRCTTPEGLVWRVAGHGRSWMLCAPCRLAFQRWFLEQLPRAQKRLADLGMRPQPGTSVQRKRDVR